MPIRSPPAILQAILNNPILKTSLNPDHLSNIGHQGGVEICLQIIKDPMLNPRLQRLSLISWAEKFDLLARPIANSPSLLKSLSIVHLAKFIDQHPEIIAPFLETMLKIAHDRQATQWDYLWVTQNLNQLMENSRIFNRFLCNTPSALNQLLAHKIPHTAILLQSNPLLLNEVLAPHLKWLFATHRRVALDIAKSNVLLDKIKVDLFQLCRHPLFKRTEYITLANNHYTQDKTAAITQSLWANVFILGEPKASLYLADSYLAERNYVAAWQWLKFAYQVAAPTQAESLINRFLTQLATDCPQQLANYQLAIAQLNPPSLMAHEAPSQLFKDRHVAAYHLATPNFALAHEDKKNQVPSPNLGYYPLKRSQSISDLAAVANNNQKSAASKNPPSRFNW